jgi:hypothetical protein
MLFQLLCNSVLRIVYLKLIVSELPKEFLGYYEPLNVTAFFTDYRNWMPS